MLCWPLSLARDADSNTAAAFGLMLVIGVAATGIRLAGITAALTAPAVFAFFVTEPLHDFMITESGDLETALLLMLVGATVSKIAVLGRQQHAGSSGEGDSFDGLLTTARAVPPADEPLGLVRAQIVTLLHIDSCRFTVSNYDGLLTPTDDGVRDRRPVEIGRHGRSADPAVAVRVGSGGIHGHYLLIPSTRVVGPTCGRLRATILLADQIGAVPVLGNDRRLKPLKPSESHRPLARPKTGPTRVLGP